MSSERGESVQATDQRALAAGLARLDAAAWRQLFEANYSRVYRYAYLRLGNGPDAEDVASSVFAEAVRSIASFRYRGIPVEAWLFRIAHHETVDALKHRSRSVQADGNAEEHGSDHGPLVGAVDRLDLGQALGQIKAEHREVLLLRFIEDRSVRDTAALLGKSEGAIKVLQHRALRSIRARIGG